MGHGDGGELVRVERAGPVTTVTLDSPHNRNALSSRLVAGLHGALSAAAEDDTVRVVVLTGTGPVFCSGADLAERLAPAPEVVDGPGMPEVLGLMVQMAAPVVLRVNGHVRAGGLGLVAAADLAVAPSSATFAFTEVKVGVAPAMIAVPALAVMHRRAWVRYALSAEVFSADEAVSAGLLTASVEDATVDGWVADAVTSLLQCSPAALGATKRLTAQLGGLHWDDAMAAAAALSASLFAGPDAAEGMAAFLEKRRPSWVTEP